MGYLHTHPKNFDSSSASCQRLCMQIFPLHLSMINKDGKQKNVGARPTIIEQNEVNRLFWDKSQSKGDSTVRILPLVSLEKNLFYLVVFQTHQLAENLEVI